MQCSEVFIYQISGQLGLPNVPVNSTGENNDWIVFFFAALSTFSGRWPNFLMGGRIFQLSLEPSLEKKKKRKRKHHSIMGNTFPSLFSLYEVVLQSNPTKQGIMCSRFVVSFSGQTGQSHCRLIYLEILVTSCRKRSKRELTRLFKTQLK